MKNLATKELQSFFKLNEQQEKDFGVFLKKMRAEYISSPIDTASKVASDNEKIIADYLNKKNISEAIIHLREASYDTFLKEETIFNGIIFEKIGNQFDIPKTAINHLSKDFFDLKISESSIFKEKLIKTLGEYAKVISPYIYALCLSNTQSRRSRAGSTFEAIIYYLYEYFKYSFDSQKKVGKSTFTKLNLGKIVDSVLPGVKEFENRRNKTIIGTMKTTLRERWQEVVEEVARSNIPCIHLLTVDNDISENKIKQMAEHNIVLVVLKDVKKQSHLANKHSVIDFETYYLNELPEIFNYWNKHAKNN